MAPSSCDLGVELVGVAVSLVCQPVKARARLADVLLGVVADAEAEQLHDFAGVVLVRLALDVGVVVEPDDHRRVAADVEQERPKLAQGVLAQQLVLARTSASAGSTLAMLVAKWLCQNSVIFSRSGWAVWTMQ